MAFEEYFATWMGILAENKPLTLEAVAQAAPIGV